MKKFNIFLAVLALWTGASWAWSAPIWQTGQGMLTKIVVTPKKHRDNIANNCNFAAQELASYLARVTGGKYKIVYQVSLEEIAQGGLIFVGRSSYTAKLLQRALRPGEMVGKIVKGNLYLLGDDSPVVNVKGQPFGEFGTYYAVCAFLERFAGVRWLWPGDLGTVVPRRNKIVLPQLNWSEVPHYIARTTSEPLDTGIHYPDGRYRFHVKKNSLEYDLWRRRMRGGSSFLIWGGHYGDRFLPRSEFQKHPEYQSLILGQRKPWKYVGGHGWVGQYCLSNPDVKKKFAQNLAELCRKNPGRIFSMTPNDGGFFCMCPACKKMDVGIEPWPDAAKPGFIKGAKYNEKIGWATNLSERIWSFTNQVVKQARQINPEARAYCLAYSFYRTPPQTLAQLDDHLTIGIAELDMYSGVESQYLQGLKHFKSWGSKGAQLGYRGYFYSLAPRPHRLGRMFQDLDACHVRLFSGETINAYSLVWLDYYCMYRLMWNPHQSIDRIINDALRAAYGPGAGAMKKYYQLAEKLGLTFDTRREFLPAKEFLAAWSPERRQLLRSYLNTALRQTQGTPAAARVRFAEVGWELIDGWCETLLGFRKLKSRGFAISDAIPPLPNWTGSPADARTDIMHTWQSWQRVKKVMQQEERKLSFATPHWTGHWGFGCMHEMKFLATTLENLYQVYRGNQGIALPRIWKFKLDPANQGVAQKWFSSEVDCSKWAEIGVDAPWEKQGYGKREFPANGADGYNGLAWYRTTVTIPVAKRNSRVFLELGAVDESGTAWVNGHQVWTYDYAKNPDPRAWITKRRIEITSAVKFGAVNTIAVQVGDVAGVGGLWKPCFILFENSAPTVPQKKWTCRWNEVKSWHIIPQGGAKFKKTAQTLKVDCPAESVLVFKHRTFHNGKIDFAGDVYYRLKLTVRGKSSVKQPLAVRLILLGATKDCKNKYVWYRLPSTDFGKIQELMLLSPDAVKYPKGELTIMLYGLGQYEVGDITLERWQN